MKTPYICLKNINCEILDEKYNFIEYKEKNKEYVRNSTSYYQKTKINDYKEESPYFNFIDEAKKDHICFLTMKDNISKQTLPKKTRVYCFHCRHYFDTIPIGLPIEYKNSKLYKNYFSEITKHNYVLQESINEETHENTPSAYQTEKQNANYYIVDGNFCSFNCCKAYLLEHKDSVLYEQSESLLNKMYIDLFQIRTDTEFSIKPAPNWRILENFGGNVSIDEFRRNFNKVEYVSNGDYDIKLPSCKSIGYIFEKKIKL
jgi:hypothetical protein